MLLYPNGLPQWFTSYFGNLRCNGRVFSKAKFLSTFSTFESQSKDH